MLDMPKRKWPLHVVKHPFEGFEDLRWKKQGSMKAALIILLAMFVVAVAQHRLTNFLFNQNLVSVKYFNVVPIIIQTVVLFLTWVVGNWAICTLLDGEGTMKNIFIVSSYALIPYIASSAINVVLSNVLVRDEEMFMTIIGILGTTWSVLLMIMGLKAVHQYSLGKTIASVLLTLAAILIIFFLLVLLVTLFQQVYVFFYSVYTEIAFRFNV